MIGLTRRQREVLAFIEAYCAREGVPPTLREIAENFHVRGPTAFGHVKALEKRGLLRCAQGRARGIELVKPGMGKVPGPIPVYGAFSQLEPLKTDEAGEDLDLCTVFPPEKSLFALRVRGDALLSEGIRDGDLLILERVERAREGAVVLALVDGVRAVLGRFVNDRGSAEAQQHLEPLSSSGIAFKSSKVLLQGELVAHIRRF